MAKSRKSKNPSPHTNSADVGKPIFQKLQLLEARIQSFQGSIPHPDILKEYENILPGSAERIFRMTENRN